MIREINWPKKMRFAIRPLSLGFLNSAMSKMIPLERDQTHLNVPAVVYATEAGRTVPGVTLV